jgi:arylsulfatase A-like enzyme
MRLTTKGRFAVTAMILPVMFYAQAVCGLPPTRAALLTGRNHHSVGMGCLANFDSGFPGYRGKIHVC